MKKPKLFVRNHLNTEMIVKYIMEKHSFITIKDETGKQPQIHVYKDGYYDINGDLILEKLIKKLFEDDFWSRHYKYEIMDYIKTENQVERSEIQPPEHLINVNNGVYNIRTNKLEPHNSKYYFLYKLPIDYNPNAKCPKIMKYFTSTLTPEYVKLSQEIFGYCIQPDYFIHGIFYLFGVGGNGKSVWIYLLIHMLGKKNVASKEIGNLMSNTFATSGLYGKLANICGEMSSKVMYSTDMLKRISAGDSIDAEFKGRDPFSFNNQAKIITACNEIPRCMDTSIGWIQRQYIIPFLKKFRLTDEAVVHLKENLVADKDEMQGLLLWSLQGLKRLIRNDRFSYKNQEKRYSLYQDSIQYFLDEYYISAPLEKYVKMKPIIHAYKKMCEKKGIPPSSDTAFGKKMRFNHYNKNRIQVANGEWIWVYSGIEKM